MCKCDVPHNPIPFTHTMSEEARKLHTDINTSSANIVLPMTLLANFSDFGAERREKKKQRGILGRLWLTKQGTWVE